MTKSATEKKRVRRAPQTGARDTPETAPSKVSLSLSLTLCLARVSIRSRRCWSRECLVLCRSLFCLFWGHAGVFVLDFVLTNLIYFLAWVFWKWLLFLPFKASRFDFFFFLLVFDPWCICVFSISCIWFPHRPVLNWRFSLSGSLYVVRGTTRVTLFPTQSSYAKIVIWTSGLHV